MKVLVGEDAQGGCGYLSDEADGGALLFVAVHTEEHDGFYGPTDHLGRYTLAELVHGWASRRYRSNDEREVARRFLAQWPEGPQLT